MKIRSPSQRISKDEKERKKKTPNDSLGIFVDIQQNKYKHWMELNRLINKLQ